MIKTEGNPSLSYVTPFFMALQFMTTTINQKTVILRNVKNPFFEDKHLLIQQLNNPIILTPIKWKNGKVRTQKLHTWITQETRFDLCISGIPAADISLTKYSSVYSLAATRWKGQNITVINNWKTRGNVHIKVPDMINLEETMNGSKRYVTINLSSLQLQIATY